MARELDPKQLRDYLDRDWARVRAAKEQFWAGDTRARGPMAGLTIGAALWAHARAVDPTWPDAEARGRDLEHHVALSRKLDRLAHVFPRR